MAFHRTSGSRHGLRQTSSHRRRTRAARHMRPQITASHRRQREEEEGGGGQNEKEEKEEEQEDEEAEEVEEEKPSPWKWGKWRNWAKKTVRPRITASHRRQTRAASHRRPVITAEVNVTYVESHDATVVLIATIASQYEILLLD